MHTEIERQNFGEFETFLFQRSLDDEQFSPCREGFVSCRPINRALGDTTSTLGTGEDIVGDRFKAFRRCGNPVPECLLGNEGEDFEHKPLSRGKLKVEDSGVKEHFLKGTQSP